MPIRISGVLKNGLGKPIPNCTIELKSKKTTLSVIATTEADQLVDVIGSYIMDVEPGEYSVSLCITGFPRKPVGDIQVYSDSRPGTLNDFLMMPDESDLTPELVLIFQQLRDEAKQAAKTAEQSQLASETVQERVEEIQSDIADKKAQIDVTAERVELQCLDAKASAQAASENADKTAQDLLASSAFKDSAENAALRAQVSSSASDESASRAEAAAGLVKTLSAEATTLPSSAEAMVFWDADTNTLNLGVPQGIKGDTGPEGVQGIQGVQGEQGDKGDKGDVGAQAQLSPLLTAISALNTAADQLIYLTGKDAAATTAISELGRKLIAATNAELTREEIGAAADDEVLKIENNLSEIATAESKNEALDNLGITGPISGQFYKFNGGVRFGWDLFGTAGEGITQANVSNPLQYGTSAFSATPMGGAFAAWRQRGAMIFASCPKAENQAYGIWKAVQHGRDFIAGLDVHLPPSGSAMVQMHVGGTDFSYYSNGSSSQSGTVNCLSVVQTSDRNKKHDIEDIKNADEIVMSWTGKTFKLNNSDKPSAGIIAQDVAEKFPIAVTVLQDGSLGVDYSTLHAPIIESVKKRITNEATMLKRIEELEARLEALSNNS